MTVDEYIVNYNAILDQDQYPISDQPVPVADNVFSVTPEGARHSTLLFVTNDDGTLRSITALSDAKLETDDLDRNFAQLEALIVWSTAAAAAIPSLTEDESNNILGTIGIEGTREFGTYASSVDFKGVRYVLIEVEDATDLIIREAN